jgi:hypothetical protein
MGITVDMLQESDTCFHGIIPTSPAYPLGRISLIVVFGKSDNFRKERIEFEVVNWESRYQAILGRPAYAKFMGVPHYAYLKLMMPGNNGTNITVHGSFSRSDNCDREFQKIAAKFGVKHEVKVIDFPSKQLTIKKNNLKEINDGKKIKQLDESIAANVQFATAEHKALGEEVKSSAAVDDIPPDTNGMALAIAGTSETAEASTGKVQEKKDPPLI